MSPHAILLCPSLPYDAPRLPTAEVLSHPWQGAAIKVMRCAPWALCGRSQMLAIDLLVCLAGTAANERLVFCWLLRSGTWLVPPSSGVHDGA